MGEAEPRGMDRDDPDGPVDGDTAAGSARRAMVERLQAAGTVRSPAVARAMATVPRHRFIDDAGIEAAYADNAVVVKRDHAGTAISSASQPTMVATMLELSLLGPGHRVLEVGTGTGYNAALLATIVGAEGRVTSIELDEDLAEAARHRLMDLDLDLGVGRVEVVTGDGAVGHTAGQPFDRIVITAGASAAAPAWIEQLAIGGRLVVPLVGADGIGEVSCQLKGAGGMDEIATVPCGFLPLRSGC